jgi:6-pyruvoyltetrahydropterin/6-carboxytetrahydropterin synthase
MPWSLTKEFKFEYAHKLKHHDGACARLHGHSGVGRVFLRGNRLHEEGPKQGMIIDFADVKNVLNPVVAAFLDHQYLNDSLQMDSPTAENIARWLYDKLKPLIPELVAVEIDETCTSSCRYEP